MSPLVVNSHRAISASLLRRRSIMWCDPRQFWRVPDCARLLVSLLPGRMATDHLKRGRLALCDLSSPEDAGNDSTGWPIITNARTFGLQSRHEHFPRLNVVMCVWRFYIQTLSSSGDF